MDIIEIITIVLRESATAALAAFAIWALRRSYEVRDSERQAASTAQVVERETFATRLETVNGVLVEKLGEVNQSLGANTEVLRRLLVEREK